MFINVFYIQTQKFQLSLLSVFHKVQSVFKQQQKKVSTKKVLVDRFFVFQFSRSVISKAIATHKNDIFK